VCAAGCTPDVGNDPVPEAMEFEPDALPPRVPAPAGLIISPVTGRIDFALAGTPLPDDCSEPGGLSEAECVFNQYLETLNGFPTATPASAPATTELDPKTLELGDTVVALATRDPSRVPDVALGFDGDARALTVRPQPSWAIAEDYWIGVRGYTRGVRALSGADVVGSPTLALLKQDTPLHCGARSLDEIEPECPAFQLLVQNQPDSEARESLFTLEFIRTTYAASGVWQRMAAAGLPKDEVAALWGFPTHTSSVAELDPSTGRVPRVPRADEIQIDVQGPVDPASVTAFVVRERQGSVVLMDLTAAASNLQAGFPRVDAAFEEGAIVLRGAAPFAAGHRFGVFVTRAVRDPRGRPLVAAPLSVLLSSPAPLVNDAGKSLLSTVPDAEALAIEAGRAALAALFDNPLFAPLTGVTREELVYCFAFELEVSR
jgi:hypothetical protein